jgi:hypothetical protein
MCVRLEVVMAVTMKSTVFWCMIPCSVVEVYQCFRGTYSSYLRTEEYARQAELPYLHDLLCYLKDGNNMFLQDNEKIMPNCDITSQKIIICSVSVLRGV